MELCILGKLTVHANSPVWGSLANSSRVFEYIHVTIIKNELAM